MREGNALSFKQFFICDKKALDLSLKGRELSNISKFASALKSEDMSFDINNISYPMIKSIKPIIDNKIIEREYSLQPIRIIQNLLHDLHLNATYSTLKDDDYPLVIHTYPDTYFLVNFRQR